MISISGLKRWAREASPSLYGYYLKRTKEKQQQDVANVLSASESPITLSEVEFDILQNKYKQWWPQYDFDAYSTGHRAYERALSFIQLESLREPGKNVLEIACGDGMTGTALSTYGHNVTLLDYKDWRDNRAQGTSFIQADLGRPIPLPNASYDFVFSFNAFEHIPDPSLAINEIIRILKPGGYIWIEFNPLYASPLGLHAFCFKMPYPQFLFSEEIIQEKLKSLGLNDLGQDLETLQPLNHWRPKQFRELWKRNDCTIINYSENYDSSHLDIVLQHPQAFRGRNLSLDDLTVAGMKVLLQKL